jgi:hypothetical protein
MAVGGGVARFNCWEAAQLVDSGSIPRVRRVHVKPGRVFGRQRFEHVLLLRVSGLAVYTADLTMIVAIFVTLLSMRH